MAPAEGARTLPTPPAASASAARPAPVQAHRHGNEAGSTPRSRAALRALIDQGEASLARGDLEGAGRAFEQAANMAHAAEIELGILRTQMQAGAYRQALAFAAHTAGVHLDDVEGAAFYAWLLNLGAQVAVADQTLKPAESRAPGDPLLRAVRYGLQSGLMRASGIMLTPPARMAPFASGAQPGAGARTVASAVLLADGRHALVPRDAMRHAARIWLRNGLGQTVSAVLAPPLDPAAAGAPPEGDLELVLLQLAEPLPVAGGETVPPRDAFPGSPAFALDYPIDDLLDDLPRAANGATGEAAWPVMRAGFLGSPLGATSVMRRLGVDLPGAAPRPFADLRGVSPRFPRGGPVYDQGGRLVGVALGPAVPGLPGTGAASQADRLVPLGALRAMIVQHLGDGQVDALGVTSSEPRPAPIGADELYERALKTTLQVLVTAP